MSAQKKKYVRKDKIILGILISLLVALFLVGIVFFAVSIYHKRELLKDGMSAIAVVDAHSLDTTYTPKAGSHTTYTIDYHFLDSAAQRVVTTKHFSISENEYNTYDIGSFIPVSYLRNNAAVNQPTEDLKRISPAYGIFIILLGVVIAVGLYVQLSKRIAKRYGMKKRTGAIWILIQTIAVLAVTFVGVVLGVQILRLLEVFLLS